ncbi:uncharacterized protein [Glycine max]|uniref:uncharacterized protein n=1 Tax=Glycine max TaxID=3847 RepID=UPI001B357C4A|nr:uncharacterized protein LOC121172956 [Glycine max]
MDEDQWMYDSIMSEEVDIDYQNEEECGVNEPHVDCSDAFNNSQVFDCRDDVLQWARSVAHENGFVAMIIRFNTNTGSRGRISFVLIGCERSGEYRCRKKEFVRRDIETRKCGCPFKLRGKLVVGGQGWMVKLMCGIHNHELTKSLVGHPYAGRLTKAEKTLIIAAEFERVHYAGKNPSTCGYVMRSTHGLPCACELSKYVVDCIPLDSIHMF